MRSFNVSYLLEALNGRPFGQLGTRTVVSLPRKENPGRRESYHFISDWSIEFTVERV